jgi:hypothetical protein
MHGKIGPEWQRAAGFTSASYTPSSEVTILGCLPTCFDRRRCVAIARNTIRVPTATEGPTLSTLDTSQ